MRKEIKTTEITCDLCGRPTKDPWNGVSESFPCGLVSMSYDIWYGGIHDVKDTCKECARKLYVFLSENKMIGHGQKR